MRKLASILVGIALATTAAVTPGQADEYWRGDIHRFRDHDFDRWRGGHWWRGWHDGRQGWWWLTMGGWYYYPAPVYPYPDPYRPPVVAVPAPAGQPVWYYCASPPGYYPYVPQCATAWQMVPARPQAPPVAALPQAMPAAPPGEEPPGEFGANKATAGTVLGAVGGGLAGAQFGRGPGKLAATALGTLLGAFVGHKVGTSLDRADIVAAQASETQAYAAPLGQQITWNNPDNGHSGTITPVRDGTDQSGNYCREFQQTVAIDGKVEQAHGTACRRPDGSWQVIDR